VSHSTIHRRRRTSSSPLRAAGETVETSLLVDRLLEQVERHSKISMESGDNGGEHRLIEDTIGQLGKTQTVNATMDFKFDDLIGYYNVSCTLTTRDKDNPVGGKWTRQSSKKLWVIRRTLQHVLPKRSMGGPVEAIAQAINVIRLDLFFGLLPVWIILRGDAVPLSDSERNSKLEETISNIDAPNKRRPKTPPLLPDLSPSTVRVYFDRPRFAFGRRTFSFGPTSSVVLDTPYVDSRIRIGKGGTSGTLFVFSRVADEDTEAISEWKWLLEQDDSKFVTKRKALGAVGIYGILSGVASQVLVGWGRKVAMVNLGLAAIGFLWAALGTGGIETRGDTYARGM